MPAICGLMRHDSQIVKSKICCYGYQSMMTMVYDGNPDSKKLREEFMYLEINREVLSLISTQSKLIVDFFSKKNLSFKVRRCFTLVTRQARQEIIFAYVYFQ